MYRAWGDQHCTGVCDAFACVSLRHFGFAARCVLVHYWVPRVRHPAAYVPQVAASTPAKKLDRLRSALKSFAESKDKAEGVVRVPFFAHANGSFVSKGCTQSAEASLSCFRLVVAARQTTDRAVGMCARDKHARRMSEVRSEPRHLCTSF